MNIKYSINNTITQGRKLYKDEKKKQSPIVLKKLSLHTQCPNNETKNEPLGKRLYCRTLCQRNRMDMVVKMGQK